MDKMNTEDKLRTKIKVMNKRQEKTGPLVLVPEAVEERGSKLDGR